MTTAAARNIFANVPQSNHLHFLDGGASYPKKVAEFLKLTQEDVAHAVGVARSTVRYDERISPEVEQRLMEIGTICEIVANYFKGDVQKAALWFTMTNPLLGNVSPRDLIRFGRYKKLMQFVLNSIAGNTP